MNIMSLHDDIDFNSPSIQGQMLEWQAKKCNNGSIPRKGWCPEIWDSILCWPSTAPGELAALSCPHYIAGFDLQANATRQCNANGQWYWSMETNSTWSNYTGCYSAKFVTVLMDMPELQSGNVTLIRKYLPVVKLISTVGYAVSLSTLIVAFCILIAIKKLRCPRNMLHMHLFVSFMLRAFMALLKEVLFISGLGLSSDVIIKNGESYWFDDSLESNWHCKAFTSIWQYFILANYSWILMEGLYLHNLIFFALFTDSNSSIGGYIILGWGLPAIFVLPWIFMRTSLEDTFCWTTNANSYVFLAIRIPIIFSVLINFVLFVNIVRVLFSKLKSTVCEETQRYKRWIRSTLVLVPLFGIHYTVFLGLSYSIGVDERVELIWLTGDQLFASFQGFFVAVLYCFLNGEVRTEVTQTLKRKKWPKLGSKNWRARSSSRCNSTCSCNATKIEDIKPPQVWWKLPWACLLQDQTIHHSTHSMASTQDATTYGCSVASSRCHLDHNMDHTHSLNIPDTYCHPTNQTSLLKIDCTNQSTLSFHVRKQKACEEHSINATDKMDLVNQRWSDSECCSSALELHPLS